ncbi:MAG TPA: hypothetical protein VFE37_00890 [Chloroflexota bacterium]|nr:hypothetical protein [Chloroflexota bacterium]
MAKQGQHNNDSRDSDKSRGHNNPSQSQTITTGTYKKKEAYARRARAHKDPDPVAQHQRNDWNPDTRDKPSIAGSTRARRGDLDSGRSGSDSNADTGTRGY